MLTWKGGGYASPRTIYENVIDIQECKSFLCPIVYVVVIKLPRHRRTEYKNNNDPNTV